MTGGREYGVPTGRGEGPFGGGRTGPSSLSWLSFVCIGGNLKLEVSAV